MAEQKPVLVVTDPEELLFVDELEQSGIKVVRPDIGETGCVDLTDAISDQPFKQVFEEIE